MNPLHWTREHKTAFFCAIALGIVTGAYIGAHEIRSIPYHDVKIWWTRGTYYRPGYWLELAGWCLAGGIFGGTIVYIRQLLRT